MADIIKLLPEAVANQIAAGEVVQRPASVVKELIENAVDAGATSITVNIQEGGRGLIQVIDNGCGLSAQDARLAFARHATSKITCADDLYALSTFGFRGEALASIASVSEVELRTRRPDDEVGRRLYVNGGAFGAETAVNIPPGTQLLVKNLFYNVPARRKFLKSKSVETKHIVDEFLRVALCNPALEMNLYDNDTARYRLPATGLRQRIVGVFGKHINTGLLEVSVETSIIRIEGFIGTPASAKKSGAAEEFLFVNNRFFKSPYFHKAVTTAYEKLIPAGHYPPYFLYMTVDPTRIDVNIHPTKTEVKFEDEQAIWQIINAAVRESLGKLGAIPLMDFDNDSPLDIPVFHADRGHVRIPSDSLNPDFNPFNEPDNEPTTPRNARASSGGGYLRNMPYSHDGVPAGWERLYEESYDTFDPASSGGDSFRNLILGEQDPDEEESVFVSQGFETEEESSDEVEFFSEAEAFQGALEIDSGLAEGFSFLNLSNRYIALASGQGLTLIDLPRAHHRVLYERFLHQNSAQLAVNQQELFPEPIPLSADDQKLLQEVRDDLLSIGFDIRVEGENAVVRGIPADIQATPATQLIDSLLHDLRQNGLPAAENRRKAVALMLAGAYSLRNARTMQREEIEELILSLYDCSEPAFTADGRAVWSLIGINDIKKLLQ